MLNKLLISTTTLLIPLLFLPFLPNLFASAKTLLLLITLSLVCLSTIISLLQSRSWKTSSSPLRFGLLAFGLALLLNLATHPLGRTESILGPSGLYLLLSLWSYLLSLHPTEAFKKAFLHGLLLSTSLLAIHSLLQLTLLSGSTFLPAFMQARSFTPTGSPLATFSLLLLGLISSLIFSLQSLSARHKTLFLTLVGLHSVALIALGSLLLPGQELAPLLLPFKAGWNIALDSLKSLQTFFFGVGLTSFGDFAARVKPLFLNTTIFWNQSLTQSSTEMLQILTTMGVLGLLTYLSLPFLTLQHLWANPSPRDPATHTLSLLALTGFVLLLIFPASLSVLFVFFSALGLLCATPPHSRTLTFPQSLILSLVLMSSLFYVGYYTFRIFSGEVAIYQAQRALAKNDGKTVYEKSLLATQRVPTLASYHLSFSQVNMSLASALSQKKDLTDTDRENITQLVSQAIREGKLAISLRPGSMGTWQNLGLIYRNLINVATDSDQFAISAYAQAVSLDPGNAPLRVEFGGLLYQLGQASKDVTLQASLLSRAQNEFQTAIQLKGDYANAYYNLAKLLETTKDYSNAYLAMQKAISLLGPDNTDLARATSELDALKIKVPKASPSPTPSQANQSDSTISQPSPFPSPLPGGPLDLPEGTPSPSL